VIRQKAKLPNADEAARQHVLDEASEKFHRGERHRPMLTVTRVVLPVERNPLTIKCDQAVIADRDTMGIASEIPEDGGGPAEGRLDVHDPIGAKQRVNEGVPLGRLAERRRDAAEVQLAARVRTAEALDEFATKHPTQNFHGQEEARVFRVHPALVIR